MRKHLGTLLIIVGVLVIAVPLVGRYMATKKQEALMADFLEQSTMTQATADYEGLTQALDWGAQEENQDELAESEDSLTVNYEENTDEETDATGLEESEAIKAKPKAIGIMDIEKIDVHLPIAEGADLATLKFALGHMPETASLGTIGNAVVAGHRSHSFGTFFNRLDEMEVGDEIKVTTGGVTYTYEVYETLIVEPDDLSVLRGSSQYRVLTLITCHPLYTSTHRLIVHAVVRE